MMIRVVHLLNHTGKAPFFRAIPAYFIYIQKAIRQIPS